MGLFVVYIFVFTETTSWTGVATVEKDLKQQLMKERASLVKAIGGAFMGDPEYARMDAEDLRRSQQRVNELDSILGK